MLIVLKLGGSILCDKNIPYSVKWDNLSTICKEIKQFFDEKQLHSKGSEKPKLIIIHGGGSFGHPVAKKHIIKDENGNSKFINMETGYWEIQKAMRKFNDIIISELQNYGISAVSIQPSSFIMFKKEGLHFDLEVVKRMLEKDLVPVIHGDIVLDELNEYKIFSGDHALPYLSIELKPDLSLHASDVNGVWDENKHIIELISSNNIENVKKALSSSSKEDVTGGMYLKVMECFNSGVKSIIFNGNTAGNIYKAMSNNVDGTIIEK
ncbi:isopentenyl phosphate kinase [Methanococcus voltae]|uniref:Isopentenyl phosphate kinase n=1 Tax=Methanococcus voltae (strain ATCC BAA-1334 / A3) TaxID=456320 RepID=D7DUV8_METV3|nr:isopentenyl phosphate kinase [Methanococcus voltae]MCS3900720.1 isopentenyl phosphate kinase [Methanococcus voltae]